MTQEENEVYLKKMIEAISKKGLIIVIGKCQISYDGRGKSKVGSGDRIIIIKQDGSVQIHRSTGLAPINWQPESKKIAVKSGTDKKIEILSIRENPREVLKIQLENIYSLVIIYGMTDNAYFTMYLDESELKNIIEKRPFIIEEDLKIVSREYKVGDFSVDFYAKDKYNNDIFIEVKDEKSGTESIAQLYKYIIEAQLRGMNVKGMLVAPEFTKEAVLLSKKLGIKLVKINMKEILEKYPLDKEGSERSTLERFISELDDQ